MDYLDLPNCCYDYRYNKYEDGRIVDDEDELEMEDLRYEREQGY